MNDPNTHAPPADPLTLDGYVPPERYGAGTTHAQDRLFTPAPEPMPGQADLFDPDESE